MTTPLCCSANVPYWDRDLDTDLVCTNVENETHDIKTFSFKAKDGRYFSFEGGQYFLFEVPVGDGVEHRCYSISSSPLRPGIISVTIKRVPDGVVSNWFHDELRPGMSLKAQGPAGTFTLPDDGARKYLFLSGGVGITPVMSMSRALADAHVFSDVVFLHAARTPRDLVFRGELESLAKHSPHFRLFFLPEDYGKNREFSGQTGRISRELLQLLVPDIAERIVMCCGPGPFMTAAREMCLSLGVTPGDYFEESFSAAVIVEEDIEISTRKEDILYNINFQKQGKSVTATPDQFVLNVARKNGVHLPSSCSNGLCGTCKSKLISGSVDMQHAGGIRQREIDAGMFLPCCSKPLSDLVIDR